MGLADLIGQIGNGVGVDTQSGSAPQGLTAYLQHYPAIGTLAQGVISVGSAAADQVWTPGGLLPDRQTVETDHPDVLPHFSRQLPHYLSNRGGVVFDEGLIEKGDLGRGPLVPSSMSSLSK